MQFRTSRAYIRWALCLVVFAAAMGHIEASIVIYLRRALAPVRQRYVPAAVEEPLPLLTAEQLTQAGKDYSRLIVAELLREPAPLIVLAVFSAVLASRRAEAVGFFLCGFGLWDIAYYLFLKLFLDWPASLGTWDVLYLIPVPWLAPVAAPLAVAAVMVLAGAGMMVFGASAKGKTGKLASCLVLPVGVGLVLFSFFSNAPQALRGEVPVAFRWVVFWVGLLLMAAALAWLVASAAWASRRGSVLPSD